ncbi:MAG TPA: hypothetical protein VLF79_02350 [Candidatus Saccharimonadales bacterium]|nr:hypothetical protein [Candidatus Saccharimonadales bacterium]
MKFSVGTNERPHIFGRVIVGLLLLFIVIGLTGRAVNAATSSGGASGLSISPLRQELTLKPGQAGKIDITLKNITGGPIVAKAAVQDFESDNVSGNPKLITNPDANNPVSIRNFLIGLGNIPMTTGQQTTFSIPVQVPANASPGAYYGLVEYQAIPGNSATAGGNNIVALSAAVGQLVFITVPGNVSERLQINKIHIYQDNKASKEGLFFTSVPKQVGIELHNFGNSFAKPFGTVTLQNSQGKTIYSYQLNGGITRSLMLPNSSRIYLNQIKNIKSPGRYTIVANVSYGKGSSILIGKKTFWYIQTWVLILVIVILIALVVLALLARRRYKRATNRHQRR